MEQKETDRESSSYQKAVEDYNLTTNEHPTLPVVNNQTLTVETADGWTYVFTRAGTDSKFSLKEKTNSEGHPSRDSVVPQMIVQTLEREEGFSFQ